MSTFITVIQHRIRSPIRVIRQEKVVKGIQFGNKEAKLFPFTNDMILYMG